MQFEPRRYSMSRRLHTICICQDYFLELIFSDDAQTEGLSSKIVIKTPKSNVESHGDEHEVLFFNLVGRSMNKSIIPTCYDATASEETGQSHIIFENLLDNHYEYELSSWPLPPFKRDCEKAIDCLKINPAQQMPEFKGTDRLRYEKRNTKSIS